MKNIIKLAQRTNLPVDPIDKLFSQVQPTNQDRLARGLAPVISLCVGEPHIKINKTIIDELITFLAQANPATLFNYPQIQGNSKTLNAIVRLYKDYYPGVDYTEEEVMICNGATQGIWDAFSILIDSGDKVLMFEPHYSVYVAQLNLLHGKLIKVPTQHNNFRPDAAYLQKLLNQHTDAKAIIFNYPNNPTGIDLTREELQALVAVLNQHPKVAILIDDVYRELTAQPHLTVLDIDPTLKNRCIVVNSPSKGLIGAPGIRAGMVAANAEWIEQMTTIQALSVTSVSPLTQQLLISGINQRLAQTQAYTDWLNESKTAYFSNIDFMTQHLISLGFNVVPGGHGFFLFVDASFLHGWKGLTTDMAIVSYLLKHAGIALIPGSAFGLAPEACYLRFSCSKPKEQLAEALQRMTDLGLPALVAATA